VASHAALRGVIKDSFEALLPLFSRFLPLLLEYQHLRVL